MIDVTNTRTERGATRVTQRRYDRRADLYDLMDLPTELLIFQRLRRKLWADVEGDNILEVGVGTGKNLSYHPSAGRVVAVDVSPRMMRRAVARAEHAARRVDFVLADAQRLPFRDGAFDSAVGTFVFCSVPDPVAGLKEVRRTVRLEGSVHLLEHVRAANSLAGKAMDLANPLAVRLTGANINRDTVANIAKAGITLDSVESKGLGVIRLIRGLRPRSALAGAEDTEEISRLRRRERLSA